MREHYEKFRNEVKEIEDLFKKKMIEDRDFINEDPELIVLLMRCGKLLKASDEFTLACIESMENQDKKIDKILEKLK